MTEKEKVFKGIERCAIHGNCYGCPYYGHGCGAQLISDVKQLLDLSQATPPGLRPCLVNGNKGFFHCWENVQKVYNPVLKGEIAGQISYVVGIVELLNGQCVVVEPGDIKFTDRSAEK